MDQPGQEVKQTIQEKKKPPIAPPRSPFIKERKIRRKVRDDDIKGILESVIAQVSETDLSNFTEPELPSETGTDFVDLNQNISENIYAQIKHHDRTHIKENESNFITDNECYVEQDENKEADVLNNNQHELMEAHNARRNELWNKVRNASNLSLHKVANNNK